LQDAQIRRLRAKVRDVERRYEATRAQCWDAEKRATKAEKALRPFSESLVCAVENFGLVGPYFTNEHIAMLRQRPLIQNFYDAAAVTHPTFKVNKA
jgi:hypothetical protein